MTDNFQPGEDAEREAIEEIRESLRNIRQLLEEGNGENHCPDICKYISSSPELQEEFSDLWNLCYKCPVID